MTRRLDITALVLAGGLGTRLREITQNRCPKPMVPVPVGGREVPFLEFVLEHLRGQGITDIILCIGHLGDQVVAHFGDGSRFGLSIRYDDAGAVDTGARVAHALRDMPDQPVLVTCGDVFLPLNWAALRDAQALHETWQAVLALVALGTDECNVALGPDGQVLAHGKLDGVDGRHALEAGVFVLRPSALPSDPPETFSLTADLFPALAAQRALGGVLVDVPFHDIGTPARYHQFCALAATGAAQPLIRARERTDQ